MSLSLDSVLDLRGLPGDVLALPVPTRALRPELKVGPRPVAGGFPILVFPTGRRPHPFPRVGIFYSAVYLLRVGQAGHGTRTIQTFPGAEQGRVQVARRPS